MGHIIVTGGTGLIGSALVSDLIGKGHRVTVLSRSPEKKRSTLPSTVDMAGWNGKSAEGWGHLVDGADVIVNLAGAGIGDSRWSEERKQEIRQSRVDAGRAVVDAISAAQSKPALLVQASAVGFYGSRGDEVLTETSSPGTDFLASVCKDWEESTESVEEMGVRRVILRTGVVLSSQDGALPKMMLPFRLFAGGPLGDGRQFFPWIHLDDEVRAIQHLIDEPSASGPFNLSAPEPPRNREFVKALGRVMNRPAFMPAPAFALKAVLGEMSTILLDGQRAVPRAFSESGFEFSYREADAALRHLIKTGR